MTRSIDEIIGEIELMVVEWQRKAELGQKAIAVLRDSKFVPSDGSPRFPGDRGPVFGGPRDPALRPEPSRTLKNQQLPAEATKTELVARKKPSGGRGKRRRYKSKIKTSEYVGIQKLKPRKDGSERFSASYWDGEKKQNIRIGVYDSEITAAIKRAEFLGDTKEVIRLRALAKEYADLNPDRPAPAKKQKFKWVCLRCGTEYHAEPQTDQNGLLPCCCHEGTRKVPAE